LDSSNLEKIDVAKSTRVVCGAGLVSLDVLLTINSNGRVPIYAGGTCGNVLAILSYFGWASFPIARIGFGSVANALRADLQQCGVREEFLIADDKAETPIIVQENRRRSNGTMSHRFVWQCPNCGNYLPMFRAPIRTSVRLLLERLPRQNAFFFDRVAPATVALAEGSADRGAIVMFEPQKQPAKDKLFDRALLASHIVKYSRDRIPKLVRPRGWRPELEIQTLGSLGLKYRLRSDGAWVHLPIVLSGIEPTDTSGAGDWTTAGILDALLRSRNAVIAHDRVRVEDAIRHGQALAAINCGYEGARGAMYSLLSNQIRDRATNLVAGKKVNKKLQGRSTLTPTHVLKPSCGACWPAVSAVRA
jgi:sugar/nucleoside kinase (ribokinase family)